MSVLALTQSGSITVTEDNAVIENLEIFAHGNEDAIDINGHSNVTIRNVLIHHEDATGIYAVNADGLKIENVSVINDAAPAAGPNAGAYNNIVVVSSDNVVLDNVRMEKGSSGLYALESNNLHATNIEGYDFRGPLPRGQLVQFDKCDNPVLDTFSVINYGDKSWTEDNVNCYNCLDPVIRNGFISGNNSPAGIGVIIEGGSGGLVENVDVLHWMNGAFMAAGGAHGVTFRNVSAGDGIALASVSGDAGHPDAFGAAIPTAEQWMGANFRGGPLSGQEAFLVYNTSATDIVFQNATYFNLPRDGHIAWDMNHIAVGDFHQADFTPRAPLDLHFPWDPPVVVPPGDVPPVDTDTGGHVVVAAYAGGGTYVAADGVTYVSDAAYTKQAGHFFTTKHDIAGTMDDALYQTERWVIGDLNYDVPVVNGTYDVTLKFAELFFDKEGQRRFDVYLENQLQTDDLDLVKAAGGAFTAHDLTYKVTVTDGNLDIDLRSQFENPKLDAFVIRQHQEPVVVAALRPGYEDYMSQDGILYKPDDKYVNGGQIYTTKHDIAGTTDDALYQTERWTIGDLKYAIPVEDAAYKVTLKFAEVFFTHEGQRDFDVFVEGQQKLDNLDLVAKAGSYAAYDQTYIVNVADGVLNIDLKSHFENPKINALLVEKYADLPDAHASLFALDSTAIHDPVQAAIDHFVAPTDATMSHIASVATTDTPLCYGPVACDPLLMEDAAKAAA